MYGKYAKAMLRSRAITAGLKSIGWEGGCGTYDDDEIPGARVQAAPPARQVPDARQSPDPRAEAISAIDVTQEELPGRLDRGLDALEPPAPPPKSPAEVLAWISSAPFEAESESDDRERLDEVAAWITAHKASFAPHDLAEFRKAYTARVNAGAP